MSIDSTIYEDLVKNGFMPYNDRETPSFIKQKILLKNYDGSIKIRFVSILSEYELLNAFNNINYDYLFDVINAIDFFNKKNNDHYYVEITLYFGYANNTNYALIYFDFSDSIFDYQLSKEENCCVKYINGHFECYFDLKDSLSFVENKNIKELFIYNMFDIFNINQEITC